MAAISSSLNGDIWHDSKSPHSYERWHFDAVSDDGRETIIISFHDNYVFSSRYAAQASNYSSENAAKAPYFERFPAVSFVYAVDGKPLIRSTIEYPLDRFKVNRENAECTIGDSSFRVDSVDYGSGVLLDINLSLGRRRKLEAKLEWLSIDANLIPANAGDEIAVSAWNVVSPRSDVTGHIGVLDDKERTRKLVHFRGTGYHDHNFDSRPIQKAIVSRHWGRAHYADTTAVFCCLKEVDSANDEVNLLLTGEGVLSQIVARFDEQQYRRNRFGIKYPTRLSFVSDENIRLRVKHLNIIESSCYHVRLLSEMTLMLRDGKPRKSIGYTEYVAPAMMKHSLVRWFTGLRIGKNGKASIF